MDKPSIQKFFDSIPLTKRETGIFLVLMIVGAGMTIANSRFIRPNNLMNIARQASFYSIIAVGETFVIVSGGIDLSVGGSVSLAGITAALLVTNGLTGFIPIIVGILAGSVTGFFNGWVITKLKIMPFIVTLGSLNIAKGVVLVSTQGYPIPIYEGPIVTLGQDSIGLFPIPVLFMIGVTILGIISLNNTPFGNSVRGVGSSEFSARATGIDIKKVKLMIYTFAGTLAGLAGILLAGRLSAGQPNAGIGWELDVIAAVIIGGTSLKGGEGSVLGTFIGAILLAVIRNGLVLSGVSMYWQTIVVGLILIGGIAANRIFSKSI